MSIASNGKEIMIFKLIIHPKLSGIQQESKSYTCSFVGFFPPLTMDNIILKTVAH